MENEYSFDDLILNLSQYIKDEKIEYIFHFLRGYQHGIYVETPCLSEKIEGHFLICFQEWLIEWIQKNVDEKYNNQSFFWYDHIKAIAENEEEECRLFYKLVKKFLEDYKNAF